MSLNYELREGQTNADLPNEGNDHFSFCVMMMVTDVGKLDTKGLELFRSRLLDYANLKGWKTKEVVWYLNYADHVKGMTTNIITSSVTDWNKKLKVLTADNRKELAWNVERALTEEAS